MDWMSPAWDSTGSCSAVLSLVNLRCVPLVTVFQECEEGRKAGVTALAFTEGTHYLLY